MIEPYEGAEPDPRLGKVLADWIALHGTEFHHPIPEIKTYLDGGGTLQVALATIAGMRLEAWRNGQDVDLAIWYATFLDLVIRWETHPQIWGGGSPFAESEPDWDLEDALYAWLDDHSDYAGARTILERFKRDGGTRSMALATVSGMWNHYQDEEEEDDHRENWLEGLYDMVSGFGRGGSVWEDELHAEWRALYPFDVPVSQQLIDENDQMIAEWCRSIGIDWSREETTYLFRTAEHAAAFRAQWVA